MNSLGSIQNFCVRGQKPTKTINYTTQYPYDYITNASRTAMRAMYSYRKLSEFYTGPVLRIKRSGDNATNDVYEDGEGNYTISDGTDFATWIGSATAYVITWYDQTEKGCNATTSANKVTFSYTNHKLTFATTYMSISSNNAVPTGNSSYSFVVGYGWLDWDKCGIIGGGTYGSTKRCNGFRTAVNQFYNYWWGSDYTFGTRQYPDNGLINTTTVIYDNTVSKRYGYVDSVSKGSYDGGNLNVAKANNAIGATNGYTELCNGALYYIFITENALPERDRLILESNYPTITLSRPTIAVTDRAAGTLTVTMTPADDLWDEWELTYNETTTSSSSATIILTGLSDDVAYDLKARVKVGLSAYSGWSNFLNDEYTIPTTPTVHATHITDSTITIVFSNHVDISPNSYNVYYSWEGGTGESLNNDTETVTLTNLDPETAYTIYGTVTDSTSGYTSENSNPIIKTTAQALSSYLPQTSSLWAVYSAGSYYDLELTDLSSNGRHAAMSGTGLVMGSGSGNGAAASIPYITGASTDEILFPDGVLPSSFSAAVISRHGDTTTGRVVAGISSGVPNVLLGHAPNTKRSVVLNGVYKTNGLNTDDTALLQTWQTTVVNTGSSTTNGVYIDGSAIGTNSGGTGGVRLTINTDAFNKGGFGFAFLAIWNTVLSDAEMAQTSAVLQNYLSSGNLALT